MGDKDTTNGSEGAAQLPCILPFSSSMIQQTYPASAAAAQQPYMLPYYPSPMIQPMIQPMYPAIAAAAPYPNIPAAAAPHPIIMPAAAPYPNIPAAAAPHPIIMPAAATSTPPSVVDPAAPPPKKIRRNRKKRKPLTPDDIPPITTMTDDMIDKISADDIKVYIHHYNDVYNKRAKIPRTVAERRESLKGLVGEVVADASIELPIPPHAASLIESRDKRIEQLERQVGALTLLKDLLEDLHPDLLRELEDTTLELFANPPEDDHQTASASSPSAIPPNNDASPTEVGGTAEVVATTTTTTTQTRDEAEVQVQAQQQKEQSNLDDAAEYRGDAPAANTTTTTTEEATGERDDDNNTENPDGVVYDDNEEEEARNNEDRHCQIQDPVTNNEGSTSDVEMPTKNSSVRRSARLRSSTTATVETAKAAVAKKPMTLLVTGNGLYPPGVLDKPRKRPHYGFQTQKGMKDVYGGACLTKQLRDLGDTVEITVNVMTPMDVFDSTSNPNSLFLLHGCLADTENRDCVDKDTTEDYLNECQDWLDSKIDSTTEVVEILVVGLYCCPRNGNALPEILKRIGKGYPEAKVTIVDITSKRMKDQIQWVSEATTLDIDSISFIEQDARAFLRGRLDDLGTTGDDIDDGVITAAMVNKSFTKNDGTAIKPPPKSDLVGLLLWYYVVIDNGYTVPTTGMKTRATTKSAMTKSKN